MSGHPSLFDAEAGQPAAPASREFAPTPGRCLSCGLYQQAGKEHTTEAACIRALKANAKNLVVKLPVKTQACQGCRQVIIMVQVKDEHARGGLAWKPYDQVTGQSHFTSCPERERFYGK